MKSTDILGLIIRIVGLPYAFGWLLVIGITTPAYDPLQKRIDPGKLPTRLQGEQGKQLAVFSGTIAVFSALFLFVWGIHHVQW